MFEPIDGQQNMNLSCFYHRVDQDAQIKNKMSSQLPRGFAPWTDCQWESRADVEYQLYLSLFKSAVQERWCGLNDFDCHEWMNQRSTDTPETSRGHQHVCE